MRRAYAVVVRRVARNFSADCPDLPGCVATGRTLDETLRRMRSAIEFHIEGLRLEGHRVRAREGPCLRRPAGGCRTAVHDAQCRPLTGAGAEPGRTTTPPATAG